MATNKDLYSEVIQNNLDFILKGNSFALFMYGQTNSGKTFTMKGNSDHPVELNKQDLRV